MNQPGAALPKFRLTLKTRDGQTVENILIAARDQADAERKLRQMYYQCEILRCEEQQQESKHNDAMSFEDILTIISE